MGIPTTTARVVGDSSQSIRELFVPYFRLLDEGIADIAAAAMDQIGGEHGYSIAPDLLILDANPDAYDLRLIPGGFISAQSRTPTHDARPHLDAWRICRGAPRSM